MNERTKTLCLIIFLLLTASAFFAQPASTPGVNFQQRWPAADPQWFELSIQPDGHTIYHSLPHQDSQKPAASDEPAPDPFEFIFTLTPQSRQLVFSVAADLPRYQPSLDKVKVAFTGTKTLRYQDATLTYNYSTAPELSRLTDLMTGISQSIELSETLRTQLRFDKLGLDATLRSVEQRASQLPEPQILEPILQRIADDPTVMNIARQRALRLLHSQLK